MTDTNMYADTKTWNPFKGCEFECSYCKPSFQQQATRQKHICDDCYRYRPHTHPERLKSIPSAEIVFVCGNGDISFCDPDFTRSIIESIRKHVQKKPDKTFYLQSKQPEYLGQFISILPEQVLLVTTLETNRDEGYEKVSKAPLPSVRYAQFRDLDYERKVVTVEPVMDFDVEIFSKWMETIHPEYVWLGYNSRDRQVSIPEPSHEKMIDFSQRMNEAGIPVKGKELRGLSLPGKTIK